MLCSAGPGACDIPAVALICTGLERKPAPGCTRGFPSLSSHPGDRGKGEGKASAHAVLTEIKAKKTFTLS